MICERILSCTRLNLGETLLREQNGPFRTGNIAPSCLLVQPITAQSLVNLVSSQSLQYNFKLASWYPRRIVDRHKLDLNIPTRLYMQSLPIPPIRSKGLSRRHAGKTFTHHSKAQETITPFIPSSNGSAQKSNFMIWGKMVLQ